MTDCPVIEIKELTKTAMKIERHYGKAMDIEWAIRKQSRSEPGAVYILQARPETVWNVRKEQAGSASKGFAEVFLENLLR